MCFTFKQPLKCNIAFSIKYGLGSFYRFNFLHSIFLTATRELLRSILLPKLNGNSGKRFLGK